MADLLQNILNMEKTVMYINRNPNYMKILKDKELYIFGAGINGRYAAHKFQKTGKIWGGGTV